MITGVQSQGEKKHTWKRSSAVKALDFICEQAVLTLALLMEDRASFLFLFPAMQLAFTAAAWEAVTEHRPTGYFDSLASVDCKSSYTAFLHR